MKSKFRYIIFVFIILFYFFISKDIRAASMSANNITLGQSVNINVNLGTSVGAYTSATLTCNGQVIKSEGLWNFDSSTINGIASKTYSYTPTSVGTYTFEFKMLEAVDFKTDTKVNGTGVITASKTITVSAPQVNNTNTNNNNINTTNNTVSNTSVKNNNAYLSKLQVDQEGLTPNFNKNKTNYTITIGENISELNITAVPEASTSKVTITGNKDLKAGDNNITITVTAQDGTKKVYTIVATKTADPVKSNSYLLNLIVENATLSPEFSKEIFEYDCGTVGASIENLKILAFGENENVNIEIIGNDRLQDGENTITVKVTSEDGTTTKEYVIKVVKDPSLVEDEEINYLKSENDNDSFLRKVYNLVRSKYGILAMLAIILIEFIFILYLYKKNNKNSVNSKTKDEDLKIRKRLNNKKEYKEDLVNKSDELSSKKRTGAKIFDKDK